MFVQLKKDSAWMRPALADYILMFRKPGDNPEAIDNDVSNEEWISWARPIWYNVRESDTLNVAEARSSDDERHIAPLQLETIRRCVRLWSNRGDLVLSPFAGIGSEGYVAVEQGRRFVGIELKPEYFKVGVRNLQRAERDRDSGTLLEFDPRRRGVRRSLISDGCTGCNTKNVAGHPLPSSGMARNKNTPPSLVASSPPPPGSASNAPSPGRYRPKRGSRPCGASTTKPPKSGTG